MKTYLTSPFIVKKIWGGPRLAAILGSGENIGETWHASTLKEGPSSVVGEKEFLNFFGDLPYLLKLIDTSDYLSIQVHPTDEYALKHNLPSGKSECWLVLDSLPGAGIYLGFKAEITEEDFFQAVSKSDDISTYLNFYPVKKGDFFYIPAGAIHAIGKGVFLAEVQQSSGVTYRVWDWNRLDNQGQPRELHVNKAREVTNFKSDFNNQLSHFRQSELLQKKDRPYLKKLIEHNDFCADLVFIPQNNFKKIKDVQKNSVTIFLLEGDGSFEIKSNKDVKTFSLKQWDCLVSFEEGAKIDFKAIKDTFLLIIY